MSSETKYDSAELHLPNKFFSKHVVVLNLFRFFVKKWIGEQKIVAMLWGNF